MTFRVAVGDHNLSENDGTEQFVSVQKVVVHPSWNRNNVAAGYGRRLSCGVCRRLSCGVYRRLSYRVCMS